MSKFSILLCLALLICSAVSIPTGAANSDIDDKIRDCESRCPITANIFKICGSDGKTYINHSELGCKDQCGNPHGRGVHQVSEGSCPGEH